MGAPRKMAARLLGAMLRLAPDGSRDWAAAMLAELDFIDGEWAALFWALGSAAAILRHAASLWKAGLKRKTNQEAAMNDTGRKALGVGLGVLSAVMLLGCAFAILRITGFLFPGFEHSGLANWLAVLAVPEALLVVATVFLWRRRGPVAAGILATALVTALHLAVHLTTH
jgi:hypothetical protein